MDSTAHPDVVMDEFVEDVDEPNYNNFNTSPDPPSPYADLEKKYRKNRFNKSRQQPVSASSTFGNQSQPQRDAGPNGKRQQKKKVRRKPGSKPSRPSAPKRNA